MYYLVDFLLRVCEEGREVAESITVEHHLSLFICASHNVPNSPQSSSLDVEREGEIVMIIQFINSFSPKYNLISSVSPYLNFY